MTLPRFEPLARLHPVALLTETLTSAEGDASDVPLPSPAPFVTVVATRPTAPLTIRCASGEDRLDARWRDGHAWLEVTAAGRSTTHRSRRFGRVTGTPDALALTLTGTQLTVFTRHGGTWTAHARVGLRERVDVRDEGWLAALRVGHEGTLERLDAGPFGQLGLRDIRVVSRPDGSPYLLDDGRALLSATSAGPGFFDTAHTSVWALDVDRPALEHRSDLFFRRHDRPGVYGDHATHLIRDPTAGSGTGEWLVATSTWGDFRSAGSRRRDAHRHGASVGVTLARTGADLLTGRHVLDTEPLPLPTDGFRSVGVWDPHLVRVPSTGSGPGGWLVGYVSARRFFRFHPVLAGGPSLDRLRLRGVDTRRRATEGTTLITTPLVADGAPLVLASDGRDGRRGQRGRYPVFDLAMNEIGTVDAPYPTNIPWPTLLPTGDHLTMIGFDGSRTGGDLLGYGTHGAVVLARSVGDAQSREDSR